MKRNKLVTSITFVALAAVVGGFVAYKHYQKPSVAVVNKPRSVNSVNYAAPTTQEQASGNAQKPQEVQKNNLNNTPASTTKTADIEIVDSSQYNSEFEVRAFISNIFEDGGTCTVNFTNASATTVTQSSSASESATTTQCATIDIPVTSFEVKGTWQLVVSYQSADASGSTTSKSVTIQ